MRIEQRRARKPKTIWNRPATWACVSGVASGIGEPKLFEVCFMPPLDSATGKSTGDGFRIAGSRSEMEHLRAVLSAMLDKK